MPTDDSRHRTVFNHEQFGNRRVDVIGCGATGSRVALSLAKLGIQNIHVWDDDSVEEHNVANQVYDICNTGEYKVDAIWNIINNATCTSVCRHCERANGSQQLGDVVFLLTDTMFSRKEIFEGALKFKLSTQLVIETRMGADNGRIYTFDPNRLSHVVAWENTLCGDEETEASSCGASISVGPTAEVISGMAVWQFMRWWSIKQGAQDQLENEIIFGLRTSTMFITRRF